MAFRFLYLNSKQRPQKANNAQQNLWAGAFIKCLIVKRIRPYPARPKIRIDVRNVDWKKQICCGHNRLNRLFQIHQSDFECNFFWGFILTVRIYTIALQSMNSRWHLLISCIHLTPTGGAPLVPPPSSANQCVDEYERNLSPLQYMKMELNTHPLYNYSQKERNIQRHQNFSLEPACSSYPSGYYTGQQHVSALISQPLCLRNQSNNNSRGWGREQLSATATGGCQTFIQ